MSPAILSEHDLVRERRLAATSKRWKGHIAARRRARNAYIMRHFFIATVEKALIF